MELHLASIWESIADAIGDQPALAHEDRTLTWRELDDRAARLAAGLLAVGIRPGSKVALDLYNCSEYLEAFYATAKLDAVHVNVNYRYRQEELRRLLDDADAEAVIVHTSLAQRVRDIAALLPLLKVVIEVQDPDAGPDHDLGPGPDAISGGAAYEQLVMDHAPLPRHPHGGGMFLSYTGGTTGLPKGVMYEMAGVTERSLAAREMICGVRADWSAAPAAVALDLHERGVRPVALPASPLMHSTAFTFASLPVLTAGGTIVTLGPRRFEPAAVLTAVERRRATVVAIVGDAFGRPLVAALDDRARAGVPADTTSLRVMCSAGVAWSADTKQRLLEHIPQLTLLDGCGSTEGGTYGISIVRAGDDLTTSTFQRAEGTIILDESGAEAPPGEIGLIAAVTATSGYYKHPEKTAETFRTLKGRPYVVPGDYGLIAGDGTITLLGRGSSVINTGGEKVHPEEVEEVLKAQPGVADAIVVGLPDERLGQIVAAVVQRDRDGVLTEVDLLTALRHVVAGYKVPRRLAFVTAVPRHPNGKADLVRAGELALQAQGQG